MKKQKYTITSLLPPVLFDSIVEPGKKYMIASGVWTEVSQDTTYEDIEWIKKVYSKKEDLNLGTKESK
jgi:hypothetical protein